MSVHLLNLQINLVSQHTVPFLLFRLGLPTTPKLSRKEQVAVGSRPDTVTCSTGNSLLFLLMVTSLVSFLQPPPFLALLAHAWLPSSKALSLLCCQGSYSSWL